MQICGILLNTVFLVCTGYLRQEEILTVYCFMIFCNNEMASCCLDSDHGERIGFPEKRMQLLAHTV